MKALLTGPNSGPYKAMTAAGRRVLQQAQRTAPVDKGFLKGSLAMEVSAESSGGKFGSVVVRVSASEEYAIHVHEGTSRMPGRPFLRNALDSVSF